MDYNIYSKLELVELQGLGDWRPNITQEEKDAFRFDVVKKSSVTALVPLDIDLIHDLRLRGLDKDAENALSVWRLRSNFHEHEIKKSKHRKRYLGLVNEGKR